MPSTKTVHRWNMYLEIIKKVLKIMTSIMILLAVVWFVFGFFVVVCFFSVSRCFKKFRPKIIVCLIYCGLLPILNLRKEYLGGSICTRYKWNLEHSSVLNTSKDDVVKYERISENNIHQQQKVTSVSHLAK